MTTLRQMKKMIKTGMYDSNLSYSIITKIENSIDKQQPLLLDGQAGCGKTAGVYFVAIKKNIKVYEFNASDDLKTKESVQRLKNKMIEAHTGQWIILIDEVDKHTNLKLLTKLIYSNKMNTNNTLIIAITNYGWTLRKRIAFKIRDTKMNMSFIEAFGTNYHKVYRPYAETIIKSLKAKSIKPNIAESISNDLRHYEKMVLIQDFKNDQPVNFNNAFWKFRDFMSKPSYKREKVPTAKELGGNIDSWIVTNGFSNHNQNSFRWYRASFQQSIELLSLAKHYGSEDLKLFLPSFWLQQGSFKHPNSI